MSQGRVQKRRIQTRARLLESAYMLMSEQGVDDTTIQQITTKADIGFGTFYTYFSSKDAIASRVLDCVIHNLGQRNKSANIAAGVEDPVAVISNSVRLTAKEMMSNPMWRWWLMRTDLMVRRMNLGFRSFGLEDIKVAQEAGQIQLPAGNAEVSWNFLTWVLAGAITDIVEGISPPESEAVAAETILRFMGVEHAHAEAVANSELPPYPELPVDFAFSLGDTE